MLMWRRVEKDNGGLYSYKIHATYDDVSAEDFLQVQIDINYRKKWDATAKQLDIIDTDPSCKGAVEGCSDMIYWEMIWPVSFFLISITILNNFLSIQTFSLNMILDF